MCPQKVAVYMIGHHHVKSSFGANNHWFVNQRNGDGVVDESNHLCCRVNEVSVSKAARVHKFILLPVKLYKASKHFRLTIDIQTPTEWLVFTVLKIVAIQSSSSETVIKQKVAWWCCGPFSGEYKDSCQS